MMLVQIPVTQIVFRLAFLLDLRFQPACCFLRLLTGREDEYTRAIREGIRRQFIGEDTSAKETETAEKMKKKREPTFLMEWKNEDDTSETLNPVYMYRNKVHLGFGKGYVAGVDMCKQRKDSQYMESLLAIRQEAVKNAAVPSSAGIANAP